MTKEDHVIICGDFGGIWRQDPENKEENYWLNWLEDKPFTTLFLDGNHENFQRLSQFPVTEWKGGKVQKIRNSVIHLMRGQVYEIEGARIFTFGGAASHDISDGILDPEDPSFESEKRRMNRKKMEYRIRGVNWWEEELPSEEEMAEGKRNLEKAGWDVDFILTHCAPTSIQKKLLRQDLYPDRLTDYLDEIRVKTEYAFWFCGHYHQNLNFSAREKIIYEQIIPIWNAQRP